MKKKESYEQMSRRLDEILSKLEKGDGELETMLALYEEGIQLTEACEKYLTQAKARIEILTQTPEGEQAVPFEGEAE